MKQIKVEYIDHMGTDLSVVNSARVSFDKESCFEYECFKEEDEAKAFAVANNGTIDYDYVDSDDWMGNYPVRYLVEADRKLIRYLAAHDHWTPFAHTAITLRVSAPIPIRTQCFKHKIGMVENEESRRYIKSVPEVFIPEFRYAPEGSIKQGSAGAIDGALKAATEYAYKFSTNIAIHTYIEMIENGIAPESARFVLPQGVMVNWIWTGNVLSFANLYKKRTSATAQKEINQVAQEIDAIIRPIFPVSWAALVGDTK